MKILDIDVKRLKNMLDNKKDFILLDVRTELETQVSKTYGNFNGENSYIEIPSDNAKIKKRVGLK